MTVKKIYVICNELSYARHPIQKMTNDFAANYVQPPFLVFCRNCAISRSEKRIFQGQNLRSNVTWISCLSYKNKFKDGVFINC
jgi:hypothetical protein